MFVYISPAGIKSTLKTEEEKKGQALVAVEEEEEEEMKQRYKKRKQREKSRKKVKLKNNIFTTGLLSGTPVLHFKMTDNTVFSGIRQMTQGTDEDYQIVQLNPLWNRSE